MIRDLTNIAKPCPMCGSKKIYMPYPKIDVIYTVHIQCADCGLNGYKNVFKGVDVDDAMERTIKYWNTRVENKKQTENVIVYCPKCGMRHRIQFLNNERFDVDFMCQCGEIIKVESEEKK